MIKWLVTITFLRWSDDNSILGTHQACDVVMADNLEEALNKFNRREWRRFEKVAKYIAIDFKEVEK